MATSGTGTSALGAIGGEDVDKDKNDDNDNDKVKPGDSASNVSSTTSSMRRRKNLIAAQLKKDALLEKHRLEKERKEFERKAQEHVDECCRNEELVQCNLELRTSELEAADEEEVG